MGFTDQSIRDKERIEPRPGGLVMRIEVNASDNGWVEVNERPVTVRGDEASTWSAANVIISAHLNNLARELAKRRKAKPAPASAPARPSKSEAKNDLARRALLALDKMLAELPADALALTGYTREECGQIIANMTHHFPAGKREDGAKWWETSGALPRPDRSEWR